MPRIIEYTAPHERLNPSERGYNAAETAGRRLGGQYRIAGSDIAQAAKTKAQALEDRTQWPFTLFSLQQKLAAGGAAGGGTSFKVVDAGHGPGPISDFPVSSMPDLASINASDAYSGYSNPLANDLSPEGSHYGNVINNITQAAARLAREARGLVGSGDNTGATYNPFIPGPNDAAATSAEGWASSLAGQSVGTGVDTTGLGGGASAASDTSSAPAGPSPVSDALTGMGGTSFTGY